MSTDEPHGPNANAGASAGEKDGQVTPPHVPARASAVDGGVAVRIVEAKLRRAEGLVDVLAVCSVQRGPLCAEVYFA